MKEVKGLAMPIPETLAQIGKTHSEVIDFYYAYDAACQRAEQAESELAHAHAILTKLGVGKEHWGVPGRIHSMYIQLKGLTLEQAALDPKLQP